MQRRQIAGLLLFYFIISSCTASTALAEKADKWDFDFAPLYLWAINLDGDATVKGKDGSLQLDFDDIFENLEGAFISHFEATYADTWGIIVDLDYLNIGQSGSTPDSDIDLNMKETVFTLNMLYRIREGNHKIDLTGGFLYNELSMEYDLQDIGFADSTKESWWDPMLGLRYGYQFSDQWKMQLRGDIGGFGVGSDFAWQTIALIDYQPWEYVSLTAGYRALDLKYSSGEGIEKFEYNVTIHGPIIGFTLRW